MALTYRYLFQRNALRIVTHQNDEYLIKFRSYKHKDKVLKLLVKHAALDSFYQQLECPNEVYQSERAQSVLTVMCDRWQRGILTNAEYLLFLNFAGGRSFNDST